MTTWDVGNSPSPSRQMLALSVLIIFMVISLICVGLHLLGHRRLGRGKLRGEDWCLLTTLLASLVTNIAFLSAFPHGAAGHSAGLLPIHFASYQKLMLVLEIFAAIALPSFKFALLWLYWRLFPKPWFRWSCLTVGGVLLANSTVAIFFFIFQCHPVSYFWNPLQKGSCLNSRDMLIAFSTVNMFGALVISILATTIIWSLKITRRKQWMLSAIFLVNLPIIAISIARLDSYRGLAPGNDGTDSIWTFYWPCLYTGLEASLGVMAGAVPGMTPVLRSEPRPPLPSHAPSLLHPKASPHGTASPGGGFRAWRGIVTTTSVSVSRSEWRPAPGAGGRKETGPPVLLWSTWDKPGLRVEETAEEEKKGNRTFLESACSTRSESAGRGYESMDALRSPSVAGCESQTSLQALPKAVLKGDRKGRR